MHFSLSIIHWLARLGYGWLDEVHRSVCYNVPAEDA